MNRNSVTTQFLKTELFQHPDCVISNFHIPSSDPFPVAKPLFEIYNCTDESDQLIIYNECKQIKRDFELKMSKSLANMIELNKRFISPTLFGVYSIVKCNYYQLKDVNFQFYLENKWYDGSGEISRATDHFSYRDLFGDQNELAKSLKENGYHNFRHNVSHKIYDEELTRTRESCILKCQNSCSNRCFNREYPYISLRPCCENFDVQCLIKFGVASIYENYLVFKSKLNEFKLNDELLNDTMNISNDIENFLDTSINDIQKELSDLNVNFVKEYTTKKDYLIYLKNLWKQNIIN